MSWSNWSGNRLWAPSESARWFHADGAATPCLEGDKHLKAELLPLASNQVGDAGLGDAETFGCFSLGESVFLDVEAQVSHQVGSHLQHGGLGWLKAKIKEHASFRPLDVLPQHFPPISR
jgi:hypothetical protein